MTRKVVRISSILGLFIAFVAFYSNCSNSKSTAGNGNNAPDNAQQSNHLQFFGYALVDGCFDDILDGASTQTNFTSEVANFSNIAQLCVFDPSEEIASRLQSMENLGVKAILSVQPLFFKPGSGVAPSGGKDQDLYPDYLQRWNQFVGNNQLQSHVSKIQMFYFADEPTWTGIRAADLKTVADLIKNTFPSVGILIVEAPVILGSLIVPTSVDFIGTGMYAVADPKNNTTYLNALAQLRSRKSSSQQKVIIVAEGRWHPDYGNAGVPPEGMKAVMTSYYELALSQDDVAGIVVYHWPGGFDGPAELGSRQLPAVVQAEHQRIGKLISGK